MSETRDFVIIGSGFGGSVAALRLSERGHDVLVVEKGKRFDDGDFARSNWNVRRYLWAPLLRCFGILEITPFRDVFVLHGVGVGGGSLGYANVLMRPDERLFAAPAWRHLQDWKSALEPHYATAERMLGVTENPQFTPADAILCNIAGEMGVGETFRPTRVGVFFGEKGSDAETIPDPYFGGEGPPRHPCLHCGGCMVGCRYGAKNTLPKNYLWLAERRGAEVRSESIVTDIHPLGPDQEDGARYEVAYQRSTGLLQRGARRLRARNVIVAAGTLGTLELLFRCRESTGGLPDLSPKLGELVRTNSEALLGSISRKRDIDYSRGIAITSMFRADPVTQIQPVRYPAGSGLMRLMGAPLVGGRFLFSRLLAAAATTIAHPVDFLRTHVLPGWAERSTVILVMQTEDNRIRLRPGRNILTLFRNRLVSHPDPEATVPPKVDVGHHVTSRFAEMTDGIALGSVNESLLGIPLTAHILGGCPFGRDSTEGVVDLDCQVHNYPGLYIVDGSIMPANPGVNPSLTIAALAEYAMERLTSRVGNREAGTRRDAELP